ncbi:3-dehydroquinate synthase [Photobacterium sp. 1_MG-2023]|uniref:3-dehydroquinate synthase n=1 Tax=Photobacterium sp. 1_MG-2023 TaxID=3062646 RepID=UPI0026E1E4C7|nr:3-dehydroquinate synthase [Photobacterium sp. 1_MG-2023]MDO6706225.1 3-dehydroquinate synthase [Photobacterium sp. 1_MG-2023]
MERITVNLGERSYNISIGTGLLSNPDYFSSVAGRQVVIISNDTVAPLYAETLQATLRPLAKDVALLNLPDGEQYKNLDTFNQIMTFLLEGSYGRDVVLVALGGGVIGDVVGFAASCFQRGVDFIQVPTTLLAQVDSSVGGKTAVNHPLGKNMIGAFYQPKAVVIDTDCLKSLPAREFAAGMAEVIKYGVIVDLDFFEWLEKNMAQLRALEPQALSQAIARCCQIKADVVAADEKESGVRALLNLGHTFGHAIEAEMGYGNWLHGEAVAAGTVQAAQTACLLGLLTPEQAAHIRQLLVAADLPVQAPETMTFDHYIKHMMRDKKVLSGKLRLVLPTGIGSAEVVADVPHDLLRQVIEP